MSARTSVQVLDHGYVTFVEKLGSDERIIEAARMSTGKGFRSWNPYFECSKCRQWAHYVTEGFEGPCTDNGSHTWKEYPKGDESLLRYLYSNKHSTPFEMGVLQIIVQAPIFVFREWHRHRTQSYNEMSARYEPLPDLNYIPTVERLMLNSQLSSSNKQAGLADGAAVLTESMAHAYRRELHCQYGKDQDMYKWALKIGVPKELARVHLPVGRYSRMMATANLRNWLAFLTLRMAPNAQWEIRQYANEVGNIIKREFPRTWDLFVGDQA